jgi:hypothetical protein
MAGGRRRLAGLRSWRWLAVSQVASSRHPYFTSEVNFGWQDDSGHLLNLTLGMDRE